jgi:hypothetical protein
VSSITGSASFHSVALCEWAIDLGPHDLAVCCRAVVPAEQRTGKVFTGLMQFGDLLIESFESLPGDGLPFADARSFEDSRNVI